MTDSPHNPNRWIDGELRRVPLPDGLLARLRQIAENGADDELDEQLCAVVLPDGLLERLCSIVDDEPLDRRVADVPLPDGLLARLREIPADEALDECIRDVPVPAALVPSTLAATRRTIAASAIRRWSIAAAAMIAASAAYLAVLDRVSDAIFQNGAQLARAIPDLPDDAGFDPLADSGDGIGELPGGTGWVVVHDALDTHELWSADGDALESRVGPAAADLAREFRRPSAFDIAASLEVDYDVAARGGLFTAKLDSLDLPPLETARPIAARGFEPPTMPGYDRLTLARTGMHPFVDPAAHPLLESTAVPLVRSTASFDALLWRLRDEAALRQSGVVRQPFDVLSSASVRVRTEEFLAAMRYDFPPPSEGPVAIRSAAGPSPFAASNVRLLLVGVQAASLPRTSRPPVDLTLAVDVSPRMSQDGRLEIARQALADALDRLRPDDRVSIVAFGATAKVLAERASPADSRLRSAIAELTAGAGSNFHAGIDRSVRIALESAADEPASRVRNSAGNENIENDAPRRQLLVLTDAPTFVTPAQRAESRRTLAAAAAQGVAVSFVDLSLAALADEDLAMLAEAANGNLRRAASTADARRWLDEALFARSTVVADDVELSLRFNPRSVAGYRLVGHEATLGLPTAPLKVSLRSGEAAVVLFEIVLRDEGTNDVGVAELEWIDPATRKTQLLTQPISRVQFANSLSESSVSLQAAAVAAEAAELLRGVRSASAVPEHSLARTLEVARAVHPRLREQVEFRTLVELIGRAQEVGLDVAAP